MLSLSSPHINGGGITVMRFKVSDPLIGTQPCILLTKLVEVMEFQMSYSKSWKMMLWKCCTQYASKFGKLSSGHRTGKGQLSFQSQRKEMPRNVQTTAQLHSSHRLVKECSKFSKPGFSNTSTMKFQIFKLVLEKAEEPKIKLPTSTGSLKKQESSRKTSTSALLTMPKPLTVWITINCGKFWKRWKYQTTWPTSWETYMRVRKQQLELDMEQQTGPNRKRSMSTLHIVTLLI